MKRMHSCLGLFLLLIGVSGCSFLPSVVEDQGPPTDHATYTLDGETCNSESCLFLSKADPDYPIGVALVTGYHLEIQQSAFGETERCSGFAITEGPPILIRSIHALIEQGNTVHSLNESGQPVISLDLSMLSPQERQQVESSTEAGPVSILVVAFSPTDQDAPVCFSRFDIIRVQ